MILSEIRILIQAIFIIVYVGFILLVNIDMYGFTIKSESIYDLWIIVLINILFLLLGIYFIRKIIEFAFKSKLTKSQHFIFDLALVAIPLFFLNLIYVLSQQNNIDMRGWWAVFMLFADLMAVAYAFGFSTMSVWLPNHRYYTLIFALLLLIWWAVFLYATGQLKSLLNIKLLTFFSLGWLIGVAIFTVHVCLSLFQYLFAQSTKKGT